MGVPIVAQRVKNLTLCLWGCGFDPWPVQWVKDLLHVGPTAAAPI